jgi:mRNA interferase RelE/StbE
VAKYIVLLQSQPEKYYRKAPPKIAKALEQCLTRLEESPRRHLTKIKKLKGYDNLYRYRIGGLRVVYEVNEIKMEVSVAAILPRGDVYKTLQR